MKVLVCEAEITTIWVAFYSVLDMLHRKKPITCIIEAAQRR